MNITQKEAVKLVIDQNIKSCELYAQGRKFASFPIEDVRLTCQEMSAELTTMFASYPNVDKVLAKRNKNDTKEFWFTWFIIPEAGAPVAGQTSNGHPSAIHHHGSYEEIRVRVKEEMKLEMYHERTLDRLADQIKDLKEKKDPLDHAIYVGSRVFENIGYRQGWWDKAPDFNNVMQGSNTAQKQMDPVDYSDHHTPTENEKKMAKEIDFSDHHTNKDQSTEQPNPHDLPKDEIHEAEVKEETPEEKMTNDAIEMLWASGVTPQELYKIAQTFQAQPGKLEMMRSFIN
jgi:hypothetical protein